MKRADKKESSLERRGTRKGGFSCMHMCVRVFGRACACVSAKFYFSTSTTVSSTCVFSTAALEYENTWNFVWKRKKNLNYTVVGFDFLHLALMGLGESCCWCFCFRYFFKSKNETYFDCLIRVQCLISKLLGDMIQLERLEF